MLKPGRSAVADRTSLSAAEYVERCDGEILATYDHRTQDSGNVSWLVRVPDGVVFVKSAGSRDVPTGVPTPYLDLDGRIMLLRNAIDLAVSCRHPVLARLRAVIETSTGPLLVYDRAFGELVHAPRWQRSDPGSMYRRFAAAPTVTMLAVFDQLIDSHVALAAAGWQAEDLYDGCLMVDLATRRLTLIDLDTYRRGPGINTMGRMFGSPTFMAPEELRLNARIDERTTVFTLGRLCLHFGTRLSERLDEFVGGPRLADVLKRATTDDPAVRYPTVAGLATAWRDAAPSRT